jgi:acetaldehyde dehydrogenase/alcohol dehydrogenase
LAISTEQRWTRHVIGPLEQLAAPMSEHRAAQMLEKAKWAAAAFSTYRRDDVLRITEAAADAAYEKAKYFADLTLQESGFGNAEHKKIKNEMCSRGIFEHYRDHDYVNCRIDAERKIVEVPKPAGVIFALIPSTNPVCTVSFKTLLAMMTRNAIVISPHPAVRETCVEAAQVMAEAAERAGAPEGAIQVITEPSMPIIESVMRSDKINAILATGGTAVVRAAYSSGNPALGVGPGNCPAFVDASADIAKAAKDISDSKAFDNSVLCTNESAVIVMRDAAEALRRELKKQGCHICSEEERQRVEDCLFPVGKFNVGMIGRPAAWIAKECGIRVPASTRILIVPLERVGDDYPLSLEKMCPVLGLFEVPSFQAGLNACRAMVRRTGGGPSAAIHSADPQAILQYSAVMNVLRVVVNAPCSTGAAGFETHLPPTMTVGTGFWGRSTVRENLRPEHLVQWTKVAFSKRADVVFPSFEGLSVHDAQRAARPVAPPPDTGGAGLDRELREQIRAIIAEELRAITGSPR